MTTMTKVGHEQDVDQLNSFRRGELSARGVPAPAHQRGLYMGTYGLVWSLAFIGGPSLGMLLFSASPPALWGVCGVLGMLAAGIILAEPRRLPAPLKHPGKPVGLREAT